jgi:hypothetical protein
MHFNRQQDSKARGCTGMPIQQRTISNLTPNDIISSFSQTARADTSRHQQTTANYDGKGINNSKWYYYYYIDIWNLMMNC